MCTSFLLCCIHLIPILLSILGVGFLSAPEPFITGPRWIPWVLGVVLYIPCLYAFSVTPLIAYFVYGEDFWVYGKRFFGGIFGLFFTVYSMLTMCEVILPMMHTALLGKSGEIEYRVTNPNDSSRRCRGGVQVNSDAGFLYSSLCGVIWGSSRNGIVKGAIIRVQGRVSTSGVYYKSFAVGRIAKEPMKKN